MDADAAAVRVDKRDEMLSQNALPLSPAPDKKTPIGASHAPTRMPPPPGNSMLMVMRRRLCYKDGRFFIRRGRH